MYRVYYTATLVAGSIECWSMYDYKELNEGEWGGETQESQAGHLAREPQKQVAFVKIS